MRASAAEQKERLRRELRERGALHSAEERSRLSANLVDCLRQQPAWQRAGAILGYVPLKDEPDILPLLGLALETGKRVALLRFVESKDAYEPAWVEHLDADLVSGRYGIGQPHPTLPNAPINLLDFVLIPGVAFDLAFGRLGRGRGYYDRLLGPVQGLKCGVAFDWQLVVDVPRESHDILLDCLVTPNGWRARTVGVEQLE